VLYGLGYKKEVAEGYLMPMRERESKRQAVVVVSISFRCKVIPIGEFVI
jgi:hypothetical protein